MPLRLLCPHRQMKKMVKSPKPLDPTHLLRRPQRSLGTTHSKNPTIKLGSRPLDQAIMTCRQRKAVVRGTNRPNYLSSENIDLSYLYHLPIRPPLRLHQPIRRLNLLKLLRRGTRAHAENRGSNVMFRLLRLIPISCTPPLDLLLPDPVGLKPHLSSRIYRGRTSGVRMVKRGMLSGGRLLVLRRWMGTTWGQSWARGRLGGLSILFRGFVRRR